MERGDLDNFVLNINKDFKTGHLMSINKDLTKTDNAYFKRWLNKLPNLWVNVLNIMGHCK